MTEEQMTKEEILFWKNRYEQEEDLYNTEDEGQLRNKFSHNGFMAKEDLVRIVKWKFQGRLKGRQKRILYRLETVHESFVTDVSRLAFKRKDDKERVKLLCCIDGVGLAVCSVILSFYDPQNYGVLDIHAWRGLFGKEPKDLFSNIQRFIDFLEELRRIASETDLSCREIEKAIFKKDLDKSKALYTK